MSGNSSASGGGIYLSNGGEIANTTISGNSASGNGSTTGLGGGLYGGGGTLTNVTIANNAAPRGSGIYKGDGDLAVRNSIVATNTGSPDCLRAGPILSAGNNIDGGTGCGFLLTSDKRNTNPLLAALADNGGPTKTHALQPGSPAIDAGSNDDCPSADQRGIQRPRDGDNNGTAICDIGAFEAPGTLGAPLPDNSDDGENMGTPGPDNEQPDEDNGDETPMPDPDNGETSVPGQTALLSEACPGVVRLPVRSTNGFAVGDTVRINPGGQTQEDARVVDVGCNGRNLHLADPLQFRHASSEAVVVVGGQSSTSRANNDDRQREQPKPKTDEQRQQVEQTNRSGRDDVHTEGDVASVDLSKQPPEIVIVTRDGRQTVQLLCGGGCPTIRSGDYVEVDGAKEHEGLFRAETVTVTRR